MPSASCGDAGWQRWAFRIELAQSRDIGKLRNRYPGVGLTREGGSSSRPRSSTPRRHSRAIRLALQDPDQRCWSQKGGLSFRMHCDSTPTCTRVFQKGSFVQQAPFLSRHELASFGNAAPQVRGKLLGNAPTITRFSPFLAFISRENGCTRRVESQRFPALHYFDST